MKRKGDASWEEKRLLFSIRKKSVYSRFGKGRIDQFFVRNMFRQLAGLFKNILQKHKGIFFKNKVFFPGILGSVTVYDGGYGFQWSFLKLGSNDLGDFFRGMAVYIVHTFLKCIGKGLDNFRMCIKITFFGTECRVRNISGTFTERCNDIAITFGLQGSCMGFEFY